MGTVQYKVVEGPTPLNDSFSASEGQSKIDEARKSLKMNPVKWWPYDTEEAQLEGFFTGNELKQEKQEKKKKEAEGLWVLECEEQDIKVDLTGGPVELGRALIDNKKISRKQCSVVPMDKGVQLTPVCLRCS